MINERSEYKTEEKPQALACLWFLFLILPLLYYSGFNPFERPKFIFYCSFVILLIILNIFRNNNRKIFFDPLFLLIILFLVVNFISDLLGLDVFTSFIGSEFRHQGFITLFCCLLLYILIIVSSKKEIAKVIYAVILSNFLVCLYCLYQIIQVFLFKNSEVLTYNGRVIGTIGNPNSLAGFLVMSLPFVFLIKKLPLFFKWSFFILNFVIIYFTGSKSGLIAFLAVLICWGFFNKNAGKKIKYAVIGVLLLTGLIFIKNSPRFSRFSIYEDRKIIYQAGFQAFTKRPLLGYGQENFELIFPSKLKMKVDSAHNIFLEILVANGLIGLSIFLLILFFGFRKSTLTCRLSLMAFIIVAFFNPISINMVSLFWLILGLSGNNQWNFARQ